MASVRAPSASVAPTRLGCALPAASSGAVRPAATARRPRRWMNTNQASPATVSTQATYMFSRRPRKYFDESTRSDSSKIRNAE